jgi:hypothetical protein
LLAEIEAGALLISRERASGPESIGPEHFVFEGIQPQQPSKPLHPSAFQLVPLRAAGFAGDMIAPVLGLIPSLVLMPAYNSMGMK